MGDPSAPKGDDLRSLGRGDAGFVTVHSSGGGVQRERVLFDRIELDGGRAIITPFRTIRWKNGRPWCFLRPGLGTKGELVARDLDRVEFEAAHHVD